MCLHLQLDLNDIYKFLLPKLNGKSDFVGKTFFDSLEIAVTNYKDNLPLVMEIYLAAIDYMDECQIDK